MSTQGVSTTRLITGEELFTMPDNELCELEAGVIKEMSPTGWRHGDIEVQFARRLAEFVDEHELGKVMSGEVGIYTARDPDTVRAADVLFISHERLSEASPEGFLDVAPELVIEIMSPTNKWEDVRRKIEEYFGIGAAQVWIVEPANRAVQVYRAPDAVHTLSGADELRGTDELDGFTLSLETLFGQ